MVASRPKHIIKLLERYGYEDMLSFALDICSDDPSTFREAISNQEKEKWMEAMMEKLESFSCSFTKRQENGRMQVDFQEGTGNV